MTKTRALSLRCLLLIFVLAILAAPAVQALEPKDSGSYLDQKAFFKPELYISSSHVAVEDILSGLPNRSAWESWFAAREKVARPGEVPPRAFLDPRSGAATNLMDSTPLIPGRGVGNRVRLADLSKALGRNVQKVDSRAVGDAVLAYVRQHLDLLKIDPEQLGAVRAVDVNPDLWQVSIPQTYHGVPVRYGRLAASLNHGNLVVIGTETWGDVKGLSHIPKLTAADAMATGYAHIGGSSALDEIVRQPKLEILPVAQEGNGLGNGYRHRLVWSFVFQRSPDLANWEVLVDAHDGEVLALQDTNHYIAEQITGGVYPITSTEICLNPAQCGAMQSGWPMPFADTGLATPNNFTNSAGVFDHTGGAVTTTLTGRYVDIVDTCGAPGGSATGSLSLGGANGQHDCTIPGGSAGNTSAARSAFYEVNKLAEMARGWLPTNTWLQNRLTTNVNINLTCNAFWNGTSINFYRSGGGCRNTGEIAAVFDHEWGHGLDDNDAGGVLSRLQRRVRGHRGHLPPAGLLRGPRLLLDLQPGLRHDVGRHGLQPERGAAGRRSLQHRLLGRARVRLGQAFGQHSRYAPGLRLHLLPHGLRPLRPAGALRGGPGAPGRLGPGGPRPAGRSLQPGQPDGLHRRQQAVLPGQRQHRRLACLHLWLVRQRLRLHQRLHAVAGH